MKKLKAAIIGTGNIGCDLMVKVMRSQYIECALMAGRDLGSKGSLFAKKLGVPVTDQSVHAIEQARGVYDIVFDATNAAAHLQHVPILEKLGVFICNLTPARVGGMCVPVLNLREVLQKNHVNMVTCGGQAILPIAHEIVRLHPETSYLEAVSTISSKSAGIGTRDNIDEFTQTTKDALAYFTGVGHTKAIIILNPAEPPIHMRATLYALVENPNMPALTAVVHNMTRRIRRYVPGYRVIVGPVYENRRVTATVGVEGKGDYLPNYAGNLDIITCAALEVAQEYAKNSLRKRGELV